MVYIRDRTNLFISYRQSFARNPFGAQSDAHPLISESIEMEELPPQWLDVTAQLDKVVNKIEQQIAQLRPLYKQNSLPGFDDRSETESRIEQLSVSTTRAIRECQALVRSFSALASSQQSPQKRKLAQNIESAMAAKVQHCSSQFRQMQSGYLKALQQDELGEVPGVLSGVHQQQPGQQSLLDDVQLSRQVLEQQQQFTTDYENEEVMRREQGINRAADTILELAEIFRDLQSLVIDQGTLVDRIDYNIQSTLRDVRKADTELVKGQNYQKRSQKCCVILLLSLIAVGLVLVLIFKPRHHYQTVQVVADKNAGSGESTGA